MKKGVTVFLLIIIIIAVVAVFYLDLFNLRQTQESKIAAILNYEDGRRASSKLVEFTKDPDSEVRKRAALAIGRIGDLSKTDALFNLLNDSIQETAEAAAFAIGLTGEREYASRLVDLYQDFTPELQAACVQAIGFLADSTMIDIIQSLIEALDHLDHRVREQAVYALFRCNAKSAGNRLAEICRNDPVRPVRVAALFSLVRMRISEPVDLYAEWLPDSESYVRSLALRGLALERDTSLVNSIASGLNDRDNNVVSQAILSLAAIGSQKAVNYLKSLYGNTTDEKLKVQLLQSFTRLESNAIVDYAYDDIEANRQNVNIVSAALNYLAGIDGEKVIPLIDSIVVTGNSYVRSNIASALELIGGENVKPRLNALFKDSSAQVRAAAFTALCSVDSGNIDYYINTALSDSDYVVESFGVDKIGELKKRNYLQRLRGIFRAGIEVDTDLKRSIVGAVAQILEQDSDSLSEDILFQALMDKDHIVSREAAQVYQEKLGQDKFAYVERPTPRFSRRKMQGLLKKYKNNPTAIVSTNRGDIEFELYFDVAPLTTANFMELAKDGFYDNLIFHRVVPNFVIQGGCSRGDGWGGPGYEIRCEYSNVPYERGTVGMATSGKDTGGSQFFITHSPQPHLDGRYTVFGSVTNGMQVVDNICRGDTIYTINILSHEIK